jgi:hypothetical protein
MSSIEQLLYGRTAPCIDGLFRAHGTSRRASVDGPALSRFELGPPLEIGEQNEYDILEIDPAASAELPDHGTVCCGEGVLGSDGFFARADAAGNPIWVVVLTNSNPFVRVHVSGTIATITNNLGNSLIVDLIDPDFSVP